MRPSRGHTSPRRVRRSVSRRAERILPTLVAFMLVFAFAPHSAHASALASQTLIDPGLVAADAMEPGSAETTSPAIDDGTAPESPPIGFPVTIVGGELAFAANPAGVSSAECLERTIEVQVQADGPFVLIAFAPPSGAPDGRAITTVPFAVECECCGWQSVSSEAIAVASRTEVSAVAGAYVIDVACRVFSADGDPRWNVRAGKYGAYVAFAAIPIEVEADTSPSRLDAQPPAPELTPEETPTDTVAPPVIDPAPAPPTLSGVVRMSVDDTLTTDGTYATRFDDVPAETGFLPSENSSPLADVPRLELVIDGVVTDVDVMPDAVTGRFEFELDATLLDNGDHSLVLRSPGGDTAGFEARLSVTIDNPVESPPAPTPDAEPSPLPGDTPPDGAPQSEQATPTADMPLPGVSEPPEDPAAEPVEVEPAPIDADLPSPDPAIESTADVSET